MKSWMTGFFDGREFFIFSDPLQKIAEFALFSAFNAALPHPQYRQRCRTAKKREIGRFRVSFVELYIRNTCSVVKLHKNKCDILCVF